MNDKEKLFRSIVEAAASSSSYVCCGKQDITAEDIYGKSRKENVSLARNIAVSLLIAFGFTISSCSIMLNRTTPAIRNMIRMDRQLQETSRVYRIAFRQARNVVRSNTKEENENKES